MRGDKRCSPVFAPGDAVIFDQYLLHRTGVKEGLAAIVTGAEAWFFAPRTSPRTTTDCSVQGSRAGSVPQKPRVAMSSQA